MGLKRRLPRLHRTPVPRRFRTHAILAAAVSCASGTSVGDRTAGTDDATEACGRWSCFETASARFERFWGPSEYRRFLSTYGRGACRDPGADETEAEELGLRHIFFVVKASKARAEHAMRLQRVWLHATAYHVFVVDDLIEGIPQHTQVVINNGRPPGGREGPMDALATSRLLIWLNKVEWGFGVGQLPPTTRWVAILGDDVFVNLARLYQFLAHLPAGAANRPVVFAHVVSDVSAVDFDAPCLSNGMAILNRAALERVAPTASCKECPYVGNDEISLAYCAFFNAVPLVHVPGLHCHVAGQADQLLTHDIVAHQWIAAGGLSASVEGAIDIAGPERRYHPFEADFPLLTCAPPPGTRWTLQHLLERALVCENVASADIAASSIGGGSEELADDDELSPETLESHLNARWPGHVPTDVLEEVVSAGAAHWPTMREALARSILAQGLETSSATQEGKATTERPRGWRFLRTAATWLHRAEVGRHLDVFHASGILHEANGEQAVVFAYVDPQTHVVDVRAGLLLNEKAALSLLSGHADGEGTPLTVVALEAHGISVVHTPFLVPDEAALPRTFRGMVSEGTVSGVWAVGVSRAEVADDLEAKAEGRRFFAGLLEENFEDWYHSAAGREARQRGECHEGAAALASARSWVRFLHDDDEHIKSVREFRSGRREFRTLHAMHRSEASKSLDGMHVETVLVARNCTIDDARQSGLAFAALVQ